MSAAIDQRVVEMRFDNTHFENNVSTTMSTLDKLKQKLNLSGATKGLESVNDAAKNVNMNGLGSAVETVTAKFSALQVMGVTALANITNSAVNAGKNIVKSLTIDPIKSGFSEYETKMGSIQTILANTEHQGTTLNDVTRALDELNTYADKTIYNFEQMTKNIGTFTAAGVDLDTSVRSIQGIANLAAVSGSTSQQASTAMYQLSQALATGTVKLMDWNSVVNAGMGGKVFQNALIRTAAMLDKSADDVEAWKAKNIDAFGSFRDSLTQGEWLTGEVLTRTLQQFTMAAEEGSDAWNKYKASLMSDGYTETQAEEILKMANTATDAATKVKTFTQLMDTLKESAQSGWAQTWELIIGDFEEAKAFFTELSDIFGGIIGKSAERRNGLFGDALTSNWDKLINKINDAGIETEKFEDAIRKIVGDDKLDSIVEDFGSIQKAAEEGAISSDVLKKALDAVAGAGEKVSLSADKLGRTLWWGHEGEDVKQLQQILDKLDYDLGETGIDGIIGNNTSKAIREFQKASGIYADGIAGPKTIEALKEAAKGIDGISDSVEGQTKSVDKSIDSWEELVDEIDKTSGRELLLDSLMNVIKAIQRPLSAIGEAFRTTFAISPDQLYGAIEKLNKFTESFVPKGILDATTWANLTDKINDVGIKTSDFEARLKDTLKDHGVDVDGLIKKYGDLGTAFEEGAISFDTIKETLLSFEGITESLITGGETADKVRRTFEGLFAAIKLVGTIAAGPLKLAFNVVTKILGRLGLSLLDVTAGVGDTIVAFSAKVESIIDTITDFIVDGVMEWVAAFKETEFFKTCAEWIESAAQTISDAITSIQEHIDEFNASEMVTRLKTFADFLSDIATSLANSKMFVSVVDTVCDAFAKLSNYLPKIKLPELNITSFTKFFSNFEDVDLSSITGAFTGLKDYFLGLTSIKWEKFKNKALEKFATFWLKTGDKVKAAFKACAEVATAIKKFIFGTEEVNLPTILGVVEKFLGIIVLIKTLNLLNGVVEPFDNITDAINNFASAKKWDAIGDAFKSMAIALAVFAASLFIISKMPVKEAWSAAGMLAGLMIVMGAVVSTMAFFVGKIDGGLDTAGAAAALLMIVVSIMLLVNTLKMIDKMNLEHPVKTFAILAGVLVALTAGIKMIAKAGGSSFKSVAAILTLVTALKMLLDVITAYDEYDWTGKSKGIQAMIQTMLVLSAAINIASRGIKAGSSAQGLAFSILAMVFSLKILLGVMKEFAAMDEADLEKGGTVVTGLLLTIGGIMALLNLTNKPTILEKGQKAVSGFAGLAAALLAVVASIWLLGKMGDETLLKGGIAVAGILLLFTRMMSKIGNACSGLKMGVLITALIGMGLLMGLAAGLIKLLEDVPWQSSLASAAAMSGLLFAITGVLIKLNKQTINAGNMTQWIGAMAGLAAIVLVLGYVLSLMQGINPANALANAAALSLLLVVMAKCMEILTKHRNRPETVVRWVGAMLGLAAVVAALGFVLASMKNIDPGTALANAIALSLLLAAMAVTFRILNKSKLDTSNIGSWIGGMAGLVAVLFGLSYVMQAVKDIDPANAIGNAVALGTLLLAMSAVMAIISAVKVDFGALKGVVALAAIAVVLAGLVTALSQISNAETARQNAITVANLAIALTPCLLALSVASMLAPSVGPGVVALVALAATLGLLVLALSKIEGVETARANAITLANLAIVLSACTVALALASLLAPVATVGAVLLVALAVTLGLLVLGLSKIEGTETARANVDIIIDLLTNLTDMVMQIGSLGFSSLTAVAALGGLLLLVKKLGEFAAKLGRLSENNDKLEDFIDNGLELFKKLAKGLGEMVSEFGVGLTSGLPAIADNLSQFADKLTPFVDIMDRLGDDVVARAKNLGEAISELISAVLYNTFTHGTLSGLGTELSEFATNISGFISAMSGIKPEVATSMESFCTALGVLAEANKDNAWTDLWYGESTLEKFGDSIASFAEGIKTASESLAKLTDADVENIKRAANAGMALADLNTAIPRQGGDWQSIIGEKDLETWGKKIVAFADALIAYSAKVSGTNIDTDAITKSATAAQSIADLNSSLPKSGGVWQDIAGESDLRAWGNKITAFADSLVAYSAKVSGVEFNTEAITNSIAAVDALAGLNEKIPTVGGLIEFFAGTQDLTTFGTGLTHLATGITAYANMAAAIDEAAIDNIKNSGTAIDELVTVMGKVQTSGGLWQSIAGEKDGQSFGTGLSAMAKGIKDYCATAAEIGEDDVTAITNSGTAVEQLSAVCNLIPAVDVSERAGYLATAAANIDLVAQRINGITVAGYDYSGLESVKTAVGDIATMVASETVLTMATNVASLQTAVDSVSTCAQTLAGLSGYNYGGVDTFKTALTNLAGANVDGVIEAFSGKGESIATAVNSIITAMSSGIKNGADSVTGAMSSLMTNALSAVTDKIDGFKTAGSNIASKLVSGIESEQGSAEDAGEGLSSKTESGIRSKYEAIMGSGAYIGAGLVAGVKSMWHDAYAAGVELGNAVNQGIKDTVEINSPSKVAIRDGESIGEGLVIGLKNMHRSVYKSGSLIAKTTLNGISNSIHKISDVIVSDIDSQPTIRPVLDLSNIEAGAGFISGMFGDSVGLSANLGSISTMMNRRSQNGANDDVVSAINKLQSRLDNIGNTTYQVNGVTYDDGSAVSNAVQDLARAMKIGRRV